MYVKEISININIFYDFINIRYLSFSLLSIIYYLYFIYGDITTTVDFSRIDNGNIRTRKLSVFPTINTIAREFKFYIYARILFDCYFDKDTRKMTTVHIL